MITINYGRHYIDKKDMEAVMITLGSDYLTTGPKIFEFEQKLCEYIWSKYTVAVWNWTQALHLAYLAIWLQSWDEIITTANTFVATSNMAIACWAKPFFCDIRMDNYNIDEKKIEKLITKKTKVIVPVHFAWYPCNMKEIWKIAKKYNLYVIEDAAHALGAEYEWKKIWNTRSDLTILSFHPVKAITTWEGWAVLTNNKSLYEKILKLRSHWIIRDDDWFNNMVDLWYNYRITDIQCALWCSQMDKLDKFIVHRKKIVDLYEKYLCELSEVILPKEIGNIKSWWHLYVVRFKSNKIRNKVMQNLKKQWYGATLHYPPVYSHTYYKKNWYKDITLPNMELYYKTCLSLPIFVWLTEKDVNNICFIIKKIVWNS